MRKITGIIVHCSATRPDWMQGWPAQKKLEEIRKWHVTDRGWSDIGYHFAIDRDGTTLPGRPIDRDGAHVKGRNKGTIGICLIGGHGAAATDTFGTHFTPEQDSALRGLLGGLLRKYGDVPITGHNEHAAKGCPGFSVPVWLAMLPPKGVGAAKHPSAAPGGLWQAIAAFLKAIGVLK